jgi:hypothetical protein
LLNLQTLLGRRVDADVALSNELLRSDARFRDLGPLTERGRPSLVSTYFVYRAGRVWSSRRKLTDEQWRGLIDQTVQREDAILAAVTGNRAERVDVFKARFISVETRREVWRRDQGRCVQCGSQERLEFDHIIPVAMGGASSARNVQLLCEGCNRQKAATLGVR